MASNRSIPSFRPFIMTVDTRLTAVTSSNSNQFILPLTSIGSPDYRFRIEWGDGKTDKIQSYNSTATTHTYISGGTYTIKIYDTLDYLYFNNTSDDIKITNINQWGNVVWKNFESTFRDCVNLGSGNIVDTPVLRKVTNMNYMF